QRLHLPEHSGRVRRRVHDRRQRGEPCAGQGQGWRRGRRRSRARYRAPRGRRAAGAPGRPGCGSRRKGHVRPAELLEQELPRPPGDRHEQPRDARPPDREVDRHLARGQAQMTEYTYKVPGAVLTERDHVVPLDHANANGPTITVFTREVAAPDGLDRPYLIFQQGGPGGEATRPTAPPSGWQKRAIADYRVLLIDQRGTGRSTPVGDIPGDAPEAQATYMTHLRADSIVRDAELIRKELGVDRWSILGQSFGGFCTLTYLSIAPDGLREAFLTGGLSPIGRSPDEVYGATWKRVIQLNEVHFARYPEDRARIAEIIRRLDDEDVRLPTGDRLTSRRFRQIGLKLGDSAGRELIHHIVELPFGSRAFLHDLTDGGGRFERNPIYATLHESSYADGFPTRWSAHRLTPPEIQELGYLTAEQVFPWMWDDYA